MLAHTEHAPPPPFFSPFCRFSLLGTYTWEEEMEEEEEDGEEVGWITGLAWVSLVVSTRRRWLPVAL